jgi:hypothetical protein
VRKLCARVNDFLNSSNIIAGEQLGFWKNPSTEKALFSLQIKSYVP